MSVTVSFRPLSSAWAAAVTVWGVFHVLASNVRVVVPAPATVTASASALVTVTVTSPVGRVCSRTV